MANRSTPNANDAAPKRRLIEAAICVLETGGPEAVQARKLAAEIGTSTMAVYTHFGGMAQLFEAMVAEGLLRIAADVEAVEETEDPMADFFAKGMAYRAWALANRRLYCLMFGLSGALTSYYKAELTASGEIFSSLPEGQAAFEVMVHSLDRVRQAGRIRDVDPTLAAGQFLSATHGFVLLEMAGYFGTEGNGFPLVFAPLGLSVMVGLGATREDAEASGVRALARFGVT
jgi:AcrR family transcriptional regulator